MAVKVTLKAGVHDVVLPDGNRYDGGSVAILTDDEYAQISASAAAAVIAEAIAATPGTDYDQPVSEADSIGDSSEEAESQ